eukprot:1794852-Amphidinium_carterae.1
MTVTWGHTTDHLSIDENFSLVAHDVQSLCSYSCLLGSSHYLRSSSDLVATCLMFLSSRRVFCLALVNMNISCSILRSPVINVSLNRAREPFLFRPDGKCSRFAFIRGVVWGDWEHSFEGITCDIGTKDQKAVTREEKDEMVALTRCTPCPAYHCPLKFGVFVCSVNTQHPAAFKQRRKLRTAVTVAGLFEHPQVPDLCCGTVAELLRLVVGR